MRAQDIPEAAEAAESKAEESVEAQAAAEEA